MEDGEDKLPRRWWPNLRVHGQPTVHTIELHPETTGWVIMCAFCLWNSRISPKFLTLCPSSCVGRQVKIPTCWYPLWLIEFHVDFKVLIRTSCNRGYFSQRLDVFPFQSKIEIVFVICRYKLCETACTDKTARIKKTFQGLLTGVLILVFGLMTSLESWATAYHLCIFQSLFLSFLKLYERGHCSRCLNPTMRG